MGSPGNQAIESMLSAAAEPTSLAVQQADYNDALRWVAQEAKAALMTGWHLPRGSRLREALANLEAVGQRTTV